MEDYFEVWWFGVNLDCNVKNSVVVKFLSIYIYQSIGGVKSIKVVLR